MTSLTRKFLVLRFAFILGREQLVTTSLLLIWELVMLMVTAQPLIKRHDDQECRDQLVKTLFVTNCGNPTNTCLQYKEEWKYFVCKVILFTR